MVALVPTAGEHSEDHLIWHTGSNDALADDLGGTGGLRMARLNVNGKTYDVDVGPDTPLLWAIRENIGLTGTKYGCGIAQCGACTVHIDGVATRSCSFPASAAEGKQITPIEGLANNGSLTKVQQAWVNNDVPQCGYCQSGMMSASVGFGLSLSSAVTAMIPDWIGRRRAFARISHPVLRRGTSAGGRTRGQRLGSHQAG
jgi:isoquinoline 1-oxidoreductase alpha subunit